MKVAFVGMRMVLLIISAHFVAAGEEMFSNLMLFVHEEKLRL